MAGIRLLVVASLLEMKPDKDEEEKSKIQAKQLFLSEVTSARHVDIKERAQFLLQNCTPLWNMVT
ncbi:MAG TPA: hypothetical protein GXX18_12420 [Bacillales bacterium]|nr:hypothetical protein [Bacillales bacterium]